MGIANLILLILLSLLSSSKCGEPETYDRQLFQQMIRTETKVDLMLQEIMKTEERVLLAVEHCKGDEQKTVAEIKDVQDTQASLLAEVKAEQDVLEKKVSALTGNLFIIQIKLRFVPYLFISYSNL